MISINSTLFEQALNFFIAFLIIKYLLVKRAIFFIHFEDNLQESLIGTVQEYQSQVTYTQTKITAHWKIIQDYFSHHSQGLTKEALFVEKIPSIVLPSIDQTTVEKETGRLAQELAKKVDHVW